MTATKELTNRMGVLTITLYTHRIAILLFLKNSNICLINNFFNSLLSPSSDHKFIFSFNTTILDCIS